jgi:hypothetical protein
LTHERMVTYNQEFYDTIRRFCRRSFICGGKNHVSREFFSQLDESNNRGAWRVLFGTLGSENFCQSNWGLCPWNSLSLSLSHTHTHSLSLILPGGWLGIEKTVIAWSECIEGAYSGKYCPVVGRNICCEGWKGGILLIRFIL